MPLNIRNRTITPADYPVVMGILNVTPDSFSDGGLYEDVDQALDHAMGMIRDGADIIDVGPESTRPGAKPVSAKKQIDLAIPVIEAIRKNDGVTPISIDTRSAKVAAAAVDAGADMINDVSALRDDPDMADFVAERSLPVVLMHRRGTSADMQAGGGPHYEDVIAEIRTFLLEGIAFAVAKGIQLERIVIDPGIGFGKRVEHNLEILQRLYSLTALGLPVLVGASRKRFLGEILRDIRPKAAENADERDLASIVCAALAADRGAAIIRVHNVAPTIEALRVARTVHLAINPVAAAPPIPPR